MAVFRRSTLRRMSPTTRKVARLVGEAVSIGRRFKNLVPLIQSLELDAQALAHAKELKPMTIYQVAEHEKCGGCNWEASKLYFASHNQEDADAMYQENERGLCGECLIELFHEEGYGILTPDQMKHLKGS